MSQNGYGSNDDYYARETPSKPKVTDMHDHMGGSASLGPLLAEHEDPNQEKTTMRMSTLGLAIIAGGEIARGG